MEVATLALFTLTALAIAISPGPGNFYVAARTLAGGRAEGFASSFGTGLGGLAHVAAGARPRAVSSRHSASHSFSRGDPRP